MIERNSYEATVNVVILKLDVIYGECKVNNKTSIKMYDRCTCKMRRINCGNNVNNMRCFFVISKYKKKKKITRTYSTCKYVYVFVDVDVDVQECVNHRRILTFCNWHSVKRSLNCWFYYKRK